MLLSKTMLQNWWNTIIHSCKCSIPVIPPPPCVIPPPPWITPPPPCVIPPPPWITPPDDPINEINSTCRDLTVIYYPCVNGNVIDKVSRPYYIYKDKLEDTKGVIQKP